MKKIIILIALLVCTGCVFISQNFNEEAEITPSLRMSKEEVKQRMGNPSETTTVIEDGKEYEVWRYRIPRVFARRYNALDTSYVEVFFFDGRVARWKKVKIYSQPEYNLSPLIPEGEVKTYEFFENTQPK